MAKSIQVSLANKCQLLFGGAVVLILTAALAVVWFRLQSLVTEGQQQTASWIADSREEAFIYWADSTSPTMTVRRELKNGAKLALVQEASFDDESQGDVFLADAIDYFSRRKDRHEFFASVEQDGKRLYCYARGIRLRKVNRLRGEVMTDEPESDADAADNAGDAMSAAGDDPAAEPTREEELAANPIVMIMTVRLPADEAAKQLMLNRIYVVAAGLAAGLLAIAVFWFITMRIILSPVRVLRNYAEQVSEGDINIRSDINTGDEFEQLSDMFNTMLENIKQQADQLRATNKSLDLKLGELAETNVALYEANKMKGEFLANVSHELRTPLNSITGFAEVLRDTLPETNDDRAEKRRRYLNNIIVSSRHLLDLINDLLDLAKIEAGRMEVRIATMNVRDTAEGLVNLVRPQAEKAEVNLRTRVPPNLPSVDTDPGKVQQILFNLLSNAIKFTPTGGTVTMSAELVDIRGRSLAPADVTDEVNGFLRISIADTGPGIAAEDHERIFEKFTQLDLSVTKEHGGTGLGLTISRDLARLLHGRIELDSEPGQGATFRLVIPMRYEEDLRSVSVSPLLSDLRVTGI